MTLLIDPYVYRQYSMQDIKVLNLVVDHIIDSHENVNSTQVVDAVINNYRTGMQARALLTHAIRTLKVLK